MFEYKEHLNRETDEACENAVLEIASALGVNIDIIN
jgi:hypothetical protein